MRSTNVSSFGLNDSRFALACGISPLIPTLLLVGLPRVLAPSVPDYSAPFIIMFSLPISYGAFVCIGLPALTFLHRLKLLTFPALALGAALSGIVVEYLSLIAVGAFLGLRRPVSASLGDLAWGAGLALSVAVPFSLIAGVPFHRRISV